MTEWLEKSAAARNGTSIEGTIPVRLDRRNVEVVAQALKNARLVMGELVQVDVDAVAEHFAFVSAKLLPAVPVVPKRLLGEVVEVTGQAVDQGGDSREFRRFGAAPVRRGTGKQWTGQGTGEFVP